MIILALDQSLNISGYAIFEDGQLIKYGTFQVNATLPIWERLGRIWENITELYNKYGFNHIVFEDVQMQYGNVDTFKKLAYVQAVILLWCREWGMPHTIYAPSSWRSALGKGWGKKRDEQKNKAIELVKNNFNIHPTSDEADAICIGMAHLKNNNKDFNWGV